MLVSSDICFVLALVILGTTALWRHPNVSMMTDYWSERVRSAYYAIMATLSLFTVASGALILLLNHQFNRLTIFNSFFFASVVSIAIIVIRSWYSNRSIREIQQPDNGWVRFFAFDLPISYIYGLVMVKLIILCFMLASRIDS